MKEVVSISWIAVLALGPMGIARFHRLKLKFLGGIYMMIRSLLFLAVGLSGCATVSGRMPERMPASTSTCLNDAALPSAFSNALIRQGDHVVLKGDLVVQRQDLKAGYTQGDEMPGGGWCSFKPSSAVRKMMGSGESFTLSGQTEMVVGSVQPGDGRQGVLFQLIRLQDQTPLFEAECTDETAHWVNSTLTGRNYFDYKICGIMDGSRSCRFSGSREIISGANLKNPILLTEVTCSAGAFTVSDGTRWPIDAKKTRIACPAAGEATKMQPDQCADMAIYNLEFLK